ncbi:MAG: chitobiase/beta-hexosaminidase C-terminal domain-containing protein [Prevotella sp.]|nr:chitobiase/beta-hexosaminidase C-terminal domain-containing protein [Prevotella sp.]
MRTKHLLTKTLLAIAGLCVGSTSAWAATETYDFGANATTWANNATLSGDAITQETSSVSVYLAAFGEYTLGNRFATSKTRSTSGKYQDWWIRSGSGWNCLLTYTGNTNNYYLSILNLKDGDKVTITLSNGSLYLLSNNVSGQTVTTEESTTLTSGTTYTISTASETTHLDLRGVGQSTRISKVVIETSAAETMGAPSIAITGANGNNRTVTITPGVGSGGSDATATYYTTDGTEPSSSNGTLYISPFSINTNTTVKAVSYLSSTIGDIASEDLEAGTTIKLATPTITLTGMVLENGVYYPQYTFNSVSTGTYGSPSITLTATLGGGNISSPYTANTAGTISVVASADGYTSSDAAEQVVAGTAYFISKSYDFTDKALRGTYEVSATTSKINNATVYVYGPIATDAITGLTLTASKWGFLASSNSAEAASRSLCARWGAGTLTYDAFAFGDILTGTYHGGSSYAMSTTSSIDLAQYAELIALNVYTPIPATSVALASGDAKHLTFKNTTKGASTWENWLIALYGNGTKAAQVRADWWDDIAATNAGFTYGYTYSSDGGTTADNTNVWATFQSDMADADIDFTLSYTGGTFYVIGTMTKGTDVYYVNFSKSGLSGTVYYDLFGNNATLSNITTAATSVVTAPAHPTNVSVTMGSNGYTTYANNVYPLDLTSAPAYKAAVAGSKVNFTLFEQAVPANTGMLVKGTANGTVNLPIADASTAVAGNDFLVNASGATFEAAANTTYYAMIKNSDPLTFGTFAPGTLAFPANKAYLTVVTGGAPSLIAIFDGGQTTGIDAVKGSEFTVDGEYYNLAGQRVAQPTKGLYIVNGKKVVLHE